MRPEPKHVVHRPFRRPIVPTGSVPGGGGAASWATLAGVVVRIGRATPVTVVQELGGRASRAQILAVCTRHQLAAGVRSGRLLHVRRDLYALPDLLAPLAVAARLGGFASYASAAQVLGLSLVETPKVTHVTVPHGAKRPPEPGVRLHRARSLPAEDVVDGYTAPLRTVLDCATTMPFAHALAVADSALAESVVTEYELRLAAARSPNRGRGRRVRVAEAADGRAENPFESVLRALTLEAGFTSFVPQTPIRTPRGLAVVDLADRRRRLVLEGDSYTFHGTRSAFARDCDRYDDLVADGWTVLRFTWEHVMLRPERVTDLLVRTCAMIDSGGGS
jgi:very-short-patch-repair endonuclease